MTLLGCPDEYEAVIVNSYTQEAMLYLPWSSITWQRVKNEISSARVEVAEGDGGVECCGPIGGLEGWDQMLRIERNGHIVWDGPITGWATPGGNLHVRAKDRFILAQKRLVGAYRYYGNITIPATVIRQLISDGDMGNLTFDPYALTVPVLSPYTNCPAFKREYVVERMERVYDVIVELCNATPAAFFTCVTDQVYLAELYCRTAATNPYGYLLLDESTTIGPIGVDVDCLNEATVAYIGGVGEGSPGFPFLVSNGGFYGKYHASVLERGQVATRAADLASLTQLSNILSGEAATPDVTLEQVQLSPFFGSDSLAPSLSNLLPGALFAARFDETCAFKIPQEYPLNQISLDQITAVALAQLDVTVSRSDGGGITETVLASCRPVDVSIYTPGVGYQGPSDPHYYDRPT